MTTKTNKLLSENKGYWTAKIQMDLYDAIMVYMQESNVNKSELAQHMGVTKGYVTQLLNGDFDHKVSKMVELALFIGKIPIVTFVDAGEDLKHINPYTENSDAVWLVNEKKIKPKVSSKRKSAILKTTQKRIRK